MRRARPGGGRRRVAEAAPSRRGPGGGVGDAAGARRAEGVREGLAAFAYCKSARLLERREPGRAAARFGGGRRPCASGRGASSAARCWPGTERGLVRAMVLGDRSEVDEATAEAFRASGTYHVLALSGAQVALLAGLRRRRAALVPPEPVDAGRGDGRRDRPLRAARGRRRAGREGGAHGLGRARGPGPGARRRPGQPPGRSPRSCSSSTGRPPPRTWASSSPSARRSASSRSRAR